MNTWTSLAVSQPAFSFISIYFLEVDSFYNYEFPDMIVFRNRLFFQVLFISLLLIVSVLIDSRLRSHLSALGSSHERGHTEPSGVFLPVHLFVVRIPSSAFKLGSWLMCTAASCGFKVFYLLRNCWSEQESLHPASSSAHWQGESGIISSCLVVKEKWTRSCSPQHITYPWLFQLINVLVADFISEIPNQLVPRYIALLTAILWIVQGMRYS